MKKFIAVFTLTLTFALTGAAIPAFADNNGSENITDIAQNAKQKEKVIGFLKERIARHRLMSTDEIISDLSKASGVNHKYLAETHVETAKFDKRANEAIDQLKALGDKDLIIAMETVEMQKIMSSGNYMFYLTQSVADCGYDPSHKYACILCEKPTTGQVVLQVLLGFITVPLDLASLPVTFIISAATGF